MGSMHVTFPNFTYGKWIRREGETSSKYNLIQNFNKYFRKKEK